MTEQEPPLWQMRHIRAELTDLRGERHELYLPEELVKDAAHASTGDVHGAIAPRETPHLLVRTIFEVFALLQHDLLGRLEMPAMRCVDRYILQHPLLSREEWWWRCISATAYVMKLADLLGDQWIEAADASLRWPTTIYGSCQFWPAADSDDVRSAHEAVAKLPWGLYCDVSRALGDVHSIQKEARLGEWLRSLEARALDWRNHGMPRPRTTEKRSHLVHLGLGKELKPFVPTGWRYDLPTVERLMDREQAQVREKLRGREERAEPAAEKALRIWRDELKGHAGAKDKWRRGFADALRKAPELGKPASEIDVKRGTLATRGETLTKADSSDIKLLLQHDVCEPGVARYTLRFLLPPPSEGR